MSSCLHRDVVRPPSSHWQSASEAETVRLGEEIGARLAPDGTVLLHGDLGSGKTVLVRGIARSLGIEAREVQSPTYTLIHEHHGRHGRLVHADLYRLAEIDDGAREALGLDEALSGPGVKAIEWPERLSTRVEGAWCIEIHRRASGARDILCWQDQHQN